MNFSARIPVAQMEAANARLFNEGFGPNNFNVGIGAASGSATHAALHCWDIPAFRAALEAMQADFPALAIMDGDGAVNFEAMLTEANLTWIQPEGAHNTYNAGDQVVVDGRTWESLIDFNVWPPGVSGWREIVADGYAPWVQPTGAHDAYPLGARVSHNGQNWENTGHAANVWAPGVFGWTVI